MKGLGLREHPCFNETATHRFARLHLPVAPKCNIQCKYCDRKYNCVNESRPGVTCKVLSPREALERTIEYTKKNPLVTVIGIAGPGDPLANTETFETLKLIHAKFPRLLKCLSTNGLLLSGKTDKLVALGVKAVTVTINCVRPATALKIYSYITYKKVCYTGHDAFELLLRKQFKGVEEAARSGISVKINTVHIPGINDNEVVEVAKVVKKLGADVLNIMPLIPIGEFAGMRRTSDEELEDLRRASGKIITVFRHCQRCRADAAGFIIEREASHEQQGEKENVTKNFPMRALLSPACSELPSTKKEASGI